MALFGKKKKEEETTPEPGSNGEAPVEMNFSPEKAKRFFERAAQVHEATNFEYAMSLWLQGLRKDPTSMAGLEGFATSAFAFTNDPDTKNPSRDTVKEFSGKGPLEKWLLALLNWRARQTEPNLAIKAAQGAADLGLDAAADWLGRRALAAALDGKKPRKDQFVAIMEVFEKFGRYDLAVRAGDEAVRLDPSDGKLAGRVKNMSAESTMSAGGFDESGQEGGFRRNIRNAEAQRHAQEEGSIVRTDETSGRIVEAAKNDYESRPTDKHAIGKYARALLDRGAKGDDKRAYEVLMKGYEDVGEFRFKEQADQIRLKQARKKLAKLKAEAEAPDADDEKRELYGRAVEQVLGMEIQVYEALVEAYPTDPKRKFELGRRYFEAERYEDAIGQFQQAKSDVKLRTSVLQHLAMSFERLGWTDEAIQTYRQAIEAHGNSDDRMGMELSYGLLCALEARGEAQDDLEAAQEADQLASHIAIQQINFKDIRARRDSIKKLVESLKRTS